MTICQRIANVLVRRVGAENVDVDQSCAPPFTSGYVEPSIDVGWDECLFDRCGDNDCRDFLLAFLNKEANYGFNTSFELAKLLSIKGSLVKEEAEAVLLNKEILEDPFAGRVLEWSYLGSSMRYEPICLKIFDSFQDVCCDDLWDGIFLASYRLNTPRIYQSLVKYFLERIEINGWGENTGGLVAVRQLLYKWDATPGFSEHRTLREKLNAAIKHWKNN